MTRRFKEAKDINKEFYYYLGRLATLFAEIETNILSILSLLVMDDFVLTRTILERNSLAENLELLKKINKYRQVERVAIDRIIQKVSPLRGTRNLFIHGVWSDPIEKENDIMVVCNEMKIVYKEDGDSQNWRSSRPHKFRISYLRKLLEDVEDTIIAQNALMKKLKSIVNE